jgi:hypothetical protein
MAFICATGIVHLPQEAEAVLALDFSQDILHENGGALGTQDERYPVVGWSFMPTQDLYLNSLGLWDQDVEKRHSESHLVGIWDANRNLLASVSIAEPVGSSPGMVTGSYGAQYHFESLTAPLLLKKDTVYYVAATLFAGTPSRGGEFDDFASVTAAEAPSYQFTVDGNIAFLSNAYGRTNNINNMLVFPDQVDGVSTYLVGANIDVTPVPLPAAAWLFGPGLVALVGARRRLGRR